MRYIYNCVWGFHDSYSYVITRRSSHYSNTFISRLIDYCFHIFFIIIIIFFFAHFISFDCINGRVQAFSCFDSSIRQGKFFSAGQLTVGEERKKKRQMRNIMQNKSRTIEHSVCVCVCRQNMTTTPFLPSFLYLGKMISKQQIDPP